jgi:hypothetical protein
VFGQVPHGCAHVTTVCSAHEDCALRPPVDVPAEHAAQALSEFALKPPRENVLLGQGLRVPEDCPVRQKYPAGHAFCVELAVVAESQKYPAEQGLDVGVVLPAAVQKPAVQDEQTAEPALE